MKSRTPTAGMGYESDVEGGMNREIREIREKRAEVFGSIYKPQMHQGGRLAMESSRFASSSPGHSSAFGSYFTVLFNCLATPPISIALAARWAMSASQIVFFRVRTHSRKLPEWLSLR